MTNTTYRSKDDLLGDAIEAAQRRAWAFEDAGDLLAAGEADIEDYCVDSQDEDEEEIDRRLLEHLKTPEQKAEDAAKKKYKQDKCDYFYEGIVREGFIPTEMDTRIRKQHLFDMERLKDVPFPFEC
jgi:hypothetical protein